MHKKVAFDAPVIAPDGSGGVETGWGVNNDAYKCDAKFIYLRGGESVQGARLQGRQPVVATIRSCPEARAITTDWRMRDTARSVIYNIRSIVPTDNRQWLEITAESGVAV